MHVLFFASAFCNMFGFNWKDRNKHVQSIREAHRSMRSLHILRMTQVTYRYAHLFALTTNLQNIPATECTRTVTWIPFLPLCRPVVLKRCKPDYTLVIYNSYNFNVNIRMDSYFTCGYSVYKRSDGGVNIYQEVLPRLTIFSSPVCMFLRNIPNDIKNQSMTHFSDRTT